MVHYGIHISSQLDHIRNQVNSLYIIIP